MKRPHARSVLIGFLGLLVGLISGIVVGMKRGLPFVLQREQWSIGVYAGDSPFSLNASNRFRNPVLKAEDVDDVSARFVADPFLIRKESTWYLFFEVYNNATSQGDLAVATSTNGEEWKYEQVVIDEPFHLSYPYVFKWQDDYYMIPESHEARSVRLYRATDFPTEWAFESTLLEDGEYLDPSIAQFNGRWWIFAAFPGNDTLRLYMAEDLRGPWQEHNMSPIVDGDANIARPGGRVLVFEDRMYRFAQDSDPTYGNQIWAFEITSLTDSDYEERLVGDVPILETSGAGWNAKAMHNVDPHQTDEGDWIAAVDGHGHYLVFGIQY